jgi:hypothetical protein
MKAGHRRAVQAFARWSKRSRAGATLVPLGVKLLPAGDGKIPCGRNRESCLTLRALGALLYPPHITRKTEREVTFPTRRRRGTL